MKKPIISTLLFLACFSLFAEMYMERATVSFYANDFHGKKTSSGEIFNMNDLTCANKSLPFDTKLKVTNLENGKSVTVRVNDRGPFVADRELDLSKAAAEKLGMINAGTAQVSIEIISRGPDTELSRVTAEKAMKLVAQRSGGKSQAKASESKSKAQSQSKSSVEVYPEGTFWDFQMGAFSTRENANQLAQKLLNDGFDDVVFQKTSKVYRVVIRKVPANQVEKMKESLYKKGYTNPLIRQRKI
ncbi:MAG: septal ring lytic transglycosylase RlpA family protein [Treponema sp.]|nr:septal ring lytic transglycosylase RlpA family protein [Treponema sp.]